MKLTNEFNSIRRWASNKELHIKGDPKTQLIKLQEEVGELAKAILKSDEEEFKDSIGDCIIVLTNLAFISNIKVEDCINDAYNVISKRTGKMQNGTFVKDEK